MLTDTPGSATGSYYVRGNNCIARVETSRGPTNHQPDQKYLASERSAVYDLLNRPETASEYVSMLSNLLRNHGMLKTAHTNDILRILTKAEKAQKRQLALAAK